MSGPTSRRTRPDHAAAAAPGVRTVLLLLAVAALGFSIVTMHAMHLGSSGHPEATGAIAGQALSTQTIAGTAGAAHSMASHTPGAAAQDDRAAAMVPVHQVGFMAGQKVDGAMPCTPGCLVDDPGLGHGMAMLCLTLLPAAALFALRLLRRAAPSARKLETPRRAMGSTTGYCGRPWPQPSLAALCILRT